MSIISISKKYLHKINNTIVKKRRSIASRKKHNQLKNTDISIVSNNCLAGIVYHDLQLQFLSPTINLFFTYDDFLEYASDIAYYSTQKPKRVNNSEYSYPVGEIQKGKRRIVIHFLHYNSFEEAAEKWVERGKRINYNKLYVIWHVGQQEGPSMEQYHKFKMLNCVHKLLLTGRDFSVGDKDVYKLMFIKSTDSLGKWVKYRSKYSTKRYIDEFDFVNYFNKYQ